MAPAQPLHAAVLVACALLALVLHGCGGDDTSGPTQTYAFESWSAPVKLRKCGQIEISPKAGKTKGTIGCRDRKGLLEYTFPAGIFEIGVQFLVPENTTIIGARNPNDMAKPTQSPKWEEQTLFLATRGATDYNMKYCKADDMVHTRVGFVLSSNCAVYNVSYQGIDTIRPTDNGALCGGAVFETKGCAHPWCGNKVNNGGSDGVGSVNVTIENVRINDYYFAEDKALVGKPIPGNYNCATKNYTKECCFCKPNGVRSSQLAVWTPKTRNDEGTRGIRVRNIVSSSGQADGINFRGRVRDAVVEHAYMQNTGDDAYALWGGVMDPEEVTFRDCTAVEPGIMRPNWYGNCFAIYGMKQVLFEDIRCKAPILANPIKSPEDGQYHMDTTMLMILNSFGGGYKSGNNITINGWTFEDLQGKPYTSSAGASGQAVAGKMTWTKSKNSVPAPVYIQGSKNAAVNVYATQTTPEEHQIMI